MFSLDGVPGRAGRQDLLACARTTVPVLVAVLVLAAVPAVVAAHGRTAAVVFLCAVTRDTRRVRISGFGVRRRAACGPQAQGVLLPGDGVVELGEAAHEFAARPRCGSRVLIGGLVRGLGLGRTVRLQRRVPHPARLSDVLAQYVELGRDGLHRPAGKVRGPRVG